MQGEEAAQRMEQVATREDLARLQPELLSSGQFQEREKEGGREDGEQGEGNMQEGRAESFSRPPSSTGRGALRERACPQALFPAKSSYLSL